MGGSLHPRRRLCQLSGRAPFTAAEYAAAMERVRFLIRDRDQKFTVEQAAADLNR
jgi:hypothetical protein